MLTQMTPDDLRRIFGDNIPAEVVAKLKYQEFTTVELAAEARRVALMQAEQIARNTCNSWAANPAYAHNCGGATASAQIMNQLEQILDQEFEQ